MSSEQKVTPWFPPRIPPAYSGYYDTLVRARGVGPLIEIRLYWSVGRGCWGASPNSSDYACWNIDQFRSWRGLAQDPSVKRAKKETK